MWQPRGGQQANFYSVKNVSPRLFSRVLHCALYLPMWMKLTKYLDENLLQIGKVINKAVHKLVTFIQPGQ